MAVICPTVLASDQADFDNQMKRVSFASRVQVDFMDGGFVDTRSIDLKDAWWGESVKADLHLMYKTPMEYVEIIKKLRPNMVIIHAEAETDHAKFASIMHANGILAGLCVLPQTPIKQVEGLLPNFDHLLIFAGTLGQHGGVADLGQLVKAKEAKLVNSNIEVGWDGGVNDQTAKKLTDGGVDVLNAGGFIQKADDPKASYQKLVGIVT